MAILNTGELSIRAVGASADDGTLSLAELARIAGGIQAALDRLALSLAGRTVRPGRRSAEAVAAVQLSITALRSGSVVLDLARTGQESIDGDSLLDRTLGALGSGVSSIARVPTVMPDYFTMPLVSGLRDLAGGIGPGRLQRIELLRSGNVIVSIDEAFRRGVRQLNIERGTEPATVVGRLHMGDFSPASLRCRIDTYAGSILCDFDVELKDAVLNAMDEMVMATGEAQLQPDGSTVRTLHLSSLQTLPTATSTTLADLAEAQGITPLQSADELTGEPIPDDEYDAFLAALGRPREADA